MFCSIGAEEHGLVGSYELVESLQTFFGTQAIVYLNMDWSVDGNLTLNANGTPSMRSVVYDVSKLIPLNNAGESMFDRWSAVADANFEQLGSGSDHRPFVQKNLEC